MESFEKYYGFSKEEAKTAVEYYREYFRDKGIFENLVYHGFEDLLKELKDNGKEDIYHLNMAYKSLREYLRCLGNEQY